jgi:two-component system response regulator
METGRDVRILLVDDDPNDLERTVEALRRRGLARALHIARGGQEALDYLFGRGQFGRRRAHPLPDLVLLDLNMPVIDGYAVLRRSRNAESLSRIPITVMCISDCEGERAMARDLRPDGYLVKPITFESFSGLAQQVEHWTLHLDLPPPPGDRALRWPLDFATLGPSAG